MLLNEYQGKAISSAIYPGQTSFEGLVYVALKLNGEAGEFAEHVGKTIRDDGAVISPERRTKLLKELGDQLWYIANAARELGATLQDVAELNIEKLADRKSRGALHGSGDER